MNNQAILKLKRFDFLLAAILLSVSLFSLISAKTSFSTAARNALVYHDGTLLKSVELAKDTSFMIGEMRIEVKQGKLRIADSNCPRKICCHSGAISEPGQVITCVPNKIFIEVSSPNEAVQYNATTY